MKKLRVELGARSYDILIGEGLLQQAATSIAPLLGQKRVIIVTDAHVAPLYLKPLTGSLEAAGIAAHSIVLPAGESSKSFATFERLVNDILALQPERKTTLIALGGGVVGDLTGFAASVILRGLPYVQMPTTLLAQVDSSVGGKTGINTPHGKNLAGSFYQPRLVLADIATLSTLPKRDLLSGYAEIVKYGLINDPDFFAWLEKNAVALLAGDAALLAEAVHHSCHAKAAIVAGDEKEAGARALLNLGHTFGHALEAETGFGDALLHGEAVAIGMAMAFALSEQLELSPAADTLRVIAHLKKVGLKTSPLEVQKQWQVDRLLQHMQQDKKVTDGRLTFILTRGIGKAFISQDVKEKELRDMLAAALQIR